MNADSTSRCKQSGSVSFHLNLLENSFYTWVTNTNIILVVKSLCGEHNLVHDCKNILYIDLSFSSIVPRRNISGWLSKCTAPRARRTSWCICGEPKLRLCSPVATFMTRSHTTSGSCPKRQIGGRYADEGSVRAPIQCRFG